MQELSLGSNGVEVAKLQDDLNLLTRGKLVVSGAFDNNTHAALQRYQQNRGIPVTGIFDPATAQRFARELRAIQYGTGATNQNTIVLTAPVNTFSGYGQQVCSFAANWLKNGVNLRIKHQIEEDRDCLVPEKIKACQVSNSPQIEPWEVIMWPPFFHLTPGRRTAYFTMWEGTKLYPESVGILNKAQVVIVPSDWNMSTFSASGVDTEIRKCPLGISTEVFRPFTMNLSGPCVFGTGGRLAAGGCRKKIDEVITAFLRAFPTEPGVQLRVKVPANEAKFLPQISDPRVVLDTQWLSDLDLAKWYGSLTAFVSASRGEGFGLMFLQAMACGRPVVYQKFSGVTEFFDEHVGYVLKHTYVPGEDFYKDCGGHVGKPDQDHMIETMRKIYLNRDEAQRKGIQSSLRAQRFTHQAAFIQLQKILTEFGVIR